MKKLLALWLALGWLCPGYAQTDRISVTELNVPTPRYAPTVMKAQWIMHPDLSGGESAVVLFRRVFELPEKPARFVVNVSADNHYTLYVNGKQVCFGPQLSDIRHWRYETVDLAPWLEAGRNVIAAEVVNYGPDRFFGIQSYRTAFFLNTPELTEKSPVHTTAQNGWRVLHNRGVAHKAVRWRVRPEDRDIIGGLYAANPTDSLNTAAYPWGWEQAGFNDADWKPAVFCESASAYGGGFAWLLEPRNTALQHQRTERLARIARFSGGTVDAGFLQGKAVTIPAKSRLTLLLDNTVLTIGYPRFRFSGGKGGLVRIGYAENLFVPKTLVKINRNQIEGQQFLGLKDIIVPDGSADRTFRPTWLRAFRFVQLEITTGTEPLIIHDFYNDYTSNPYPVKASFSANNPDYAGIFALCRRTAEVCTQDYFLSDAYYETMQYLGDSKVHDLTWLALTGNDHHVRNALEQFHYSRLWDGNLTSCYPLRSTFVLPTYSVIWVDMLWDYLLWSGDKAFIRQFVPGIHQTLAMFDGLMKPDGIAGATRWAHFVDWYQDSSRGGLAGGQDGSNSAVVTLHYVYALQNAARIFDALGDPASATTYRQRADRIKKQVYAACFDAQRGLLSERPLSAQPVGKRYFDQHTNIMGVLTDALPADRQVAALQTILSDTTISQATYYYRFYLFEALQKAGGGVAAGQQEKVAALIAPALAPWKKLLADGLTTTPERFASAGKAMRSECHPWSTAPAYHFFSTIAGVRPAEPGFKTLSMRPLFGELNQIEGTYPHPAGELTFRLEQQGQKLTGSVTLPAGVSGTLVWKGRTLPLKAGRQSVGL
ncbi:alpha-L-rhamnosidase C-terminal domain-containing protein [Larkinella sp. VNQ87]|uniref:alpha-L-rhamnosidase-related protein n=1 Tax=Larkinella sp. VNQ87 TaxID=3400921 RepID=UPI003C07F3E9